jgi:hypothetical protein
LTSFFMEGERRTMEWKLELVPIPVSDVDRAKAFYAGKVGFNVDLDVNADTAGETTTAKPVTAISQTAARRS